MPGHQIISPTLPYPTHLGRTKLYYPLVARWAHGHNSSRLLITTPSPPPSAWPLPRPASGRGVVECSRGGAACCYASLAPAGVIVLAAPRGLHLLRKYVSK